MLTFSSSYARGKVLLCPPSNGSITLYNEEAIQKNKFDSKNYSKLYVNYNPVVIGKCYSKGKNVIQIIYIDDTPTAMVFPEKVKISALDGSLDAYADYRYHINALGQGDTKATRLSDRPSFLWYPYALYASLDSMANSIFYYVGDNKRFKKGYQYLLGKPYFMKPESSSSFDRVKHLFVDIKPLFESSNNSYRYSSKVELEPNGGRSHDGFKITEILNDFVSEDTFKLNCRLKYDADSIQLFIDKYVGEEIYINKKLTLFESSSLLQSGYWLVDSVSFIRPQTCIPSPDFAYYMHITSPNDSLENYLAQIPTNFYDYIELASIKKRRERVAKERKAKAEREAELAVDREIQEMEDGYAKLYGRTNAKLIMDGEVKLGWTKKMCEESWGMPSEVTKTSMREIWWYGYGTLYFEGNKLVLVHQKS